MGKPHEQLDAWKLGMELAMQTFAITAGFPSEERFGLSQPMRRAAVSIPSNIAEGAARSGPWEYARFLSIARGSHAELDTQMQLAVMLGWLDKQHTVFELIDHVGKLLTGLHRKWSLQ